MSKNQKNEKMGNTKTPGEDGNSTNEDASHATSEDLEGRSFLWC